MTTQDVHIHGRAPEQDAAPARPGCGCGHEEGPVVLDARPIPHAVRHGAVLGALGSVPVGGALVLVAPHDPLPLLRQVQEMIPVEIDYLDRSPGEVHVRITRRPV